MSNVKNFAMLAILAIAGFFATNIAAYAQPDCSCVIVDGCKVVTFYDEFGNPISTETICPSTGTGDFNCTKEIPPTGPLNVSIPPVSINAVGQSPTYGTIQTEIDRTRTSSNAIIRSLNEKERFPASVRFSFYAVSTIAGVRYQSRTELVFVNNAVYSFGPFNRERFCLERDVEFVREGDLSGPTAFVLNAGGTCVALN